MERFEFKRQEKPEIEEGEKMPAFEREREKLVQQIEQAHTEDIEKIKRIDEKWSKIRNKPEYKSEFGDPKNFMTPEDYQKCKELSDQSDEFQKKCLELTRKSLNLLAEDPNTEWRRMPYTGAPGALAETNSRHYRARIGRQYELELSWYNYPEDIETIGDPKTYTENFEAMIKGTKEVTTKSGLLRRKKVEKSDFPFINLSVEFDTTDKPESSRELKHFDDETQRQIQEELIQQVRKVKEKLG